MKKVLTRNIPLKILSFLLAVVLWVVIMNIQDPYITRTIEDISVVELNTDVFDNISKIYEVESGKTVSIKVKGKRSVIEYLKNTDFEATADFREMSIVNAVPIRITAKESSRYDVSDIEIIDSNDMMTLSLEEADTQTFRVNVKTTGTAKEGYYVTDLVANPNIIEISGSKKQIAKIKEVIVEVSIEQVNDTFEVITFPRALDENGYPVDSAKLEFQSREIEVTATVLPTKEIGVIVSKEGTPFYGYTFIKMVHEPKVITIAGTKEDLAIIGYITIPFDISLSKETLVDRKYIEDYLDMSKYSIVGDTNSVEITATIERLDTKEIVVNPAELRIFNLDLNYNAIIQTPGPFTIHVMGPADVLSTVTADTLKPSIDLLGYEKGTYSISVYCSLAENLSIRPLTISVELVEKSEE